MRFCLAATAFGVGVLLAGCSAPPPAANEPAATETSVEPDALALAQQEAATDEERLAAEARMGPPRTVRESRKPPASERASTDPAVPEVSAGSAPTDTQVVVGDAALPDPAVPAPPPPALPSMSSGATDQAIDEWRNEFRRVSDPRSARDALLLAVTDAARGGSIPATSQLAPAQQRTVDAISGAVARILAGPTPADPAAAASELEAASSALRSDRGVRISKVVLCRRVDGFGRYDAIDQDRLPAGRGTKFIVYVEVEGFSHRDVIADGVARFGVELGQELTLRSGSDGTLQWRRAETSVSESSRSRRRDFYLVDTVELPGTLGVGAFNFRVTVRDGVSGTSDETTVPITVMADPGAR